MPWLAALAPEAVAGVAEVAGAGAAEAGAGAAEAGAGAAEAGASEAGAAEEAGSSRLGQFNQARQQQGGSKSKQDPAAQVNAGLSSEFNAEVGERGW